MQASGRDHLRELLNRASGGVVFTTIHKFMPEKGEAMPELSARQNIVVIADEAHRSQYGFGGKVNEKTGEMSYGFASNLRDALPNASFIGLTPSLPPLGRASPNAAHCLSRSAPSLQSPARPSRRRTRTRGRSLAITSASTTSSAPSPTRPRCRSITIAAFDSLAAPLGRASPSSRMKTALSERAPYLARRA